MSGFWESELGEITGNSEDAFSKSSPFVQIPDGTMALARIESFVHHEYNNIKSLMINWLLIDGDFKGAKVKHKLKVIDPDPIDKDPEKVRYRALNMMKLIYQLFNVKRAHPNMPTDQDLSVFAGKEAGIKIRETDPNKNGKQYNYVSEVHSAKGFKCESGTSLVITHKTQSYDYSDIDSALSRNSKYTNDNTIEDINF